MGSYQVLIQECKQQIAEIIKAGEWELLENYEQKLRELQDEYMEVTYATHK